MNALSATESLTVIIPGAPAHMFVGFAGEVNEASSHS